MILMNKLAQRPTLPMVDAPQQNQLMPALRPMQPRAPVAPAQPQGIPQRMMNIPQRGAMGMQNPQEQRRFVADLPANVQLQGIQNIMNGQSVNPMIDNFVKTMASQGNTPEQIRQAFIAHQQSSPNPLILR